MARAGCYVYGLIRAADVRDIPLPHELCERVRTSLLFVAPLLHRVGHAIDIHLHEIFRPTMSLILPRSPLDDLDAVVAYLQGLGTILRNVR